MLGGSWEPEATLVLLGYLSSCSSSTPCFLLCPGRTQPVLILVCCFNSALSAVTFDAPPLFAWVTSRTRLCHIDDPRSFTSRTSISTTPIRLTLQSLGTYGCEKYTECIFKFFTTRLSLFNEYEIYGTTYEYICTYIHTYIHTYIQTPLAFNTLMWGSLRLAPNRQFSVFTTSVGRAQRAPIIVSRLYVGMAQTYNISINQSINQSLLSPAEMQPAHEGL